MKCLLILTLVGIATAFQKSPPPSFLLRQAVWPSSLSSSSSSARLESSSSLDEDFVRAVECATKFGLCNLEELERLATKLDKVDDDECLFEKNILCEKEIDDRKDLAEVLRLQSELRLRMDYVENANLFSEDVTKERDIREREELLEILGEDAM